MVFHLAHISHEDIGAAMPSGKQKRKRVVASCTQCYAKKQKVRLTSVSSWIGVHNADRAEGSSAIISILATTAPVEGSRSFAATTR